MINSNEKGALHLDQQGSNGGMFAKGTHKEHTRSTFCHAGT